MILKDKLVIFWTKVNSIYYLEFNNNLKIKKTEKY